MKVIVTEAALSDMVQIGRWIQEGNPERAESFVSELQKRCKGLEQMPFAFPLLPGREASGIRRKPYRDYLIFYRIDKDEIVILHVLHGARDYEHILFPDP